MGAKIAGVGELVMALDPVTSLGSGAALGGAAIYAWIKVGPMLIGKLNGNGNGNGKPNGNGTSDLKLEIALAPLIASSVRQEAALTRMENTLTMINNTIIGVSARSGHRG